MLKLYYIWPVDWMGPVNFACPHFHKTFTVFFYDDDMTTQQILIEIEQTKNLTETGRQAEKILVRDTQETLKLMTELFRQGVHDTYVTISDHEGLEWDAKLRRFIYHRGHTSQFLELARKEVLLRIRPFLKEIHKRFLHNAA
ncbi:MAG: hypothetical protein ACJ76H_12260 [Bacteriovoracaceae bacterium]